MTRLEALEKALEAARELVKECFDTQENTLVQHGLERLDKALAALETAEKEPTNETVIGTGFYSDATPGTFGPSEWLDLLIACQDGRVSCMHGLEILEREVNTLRNPPKHIYWGAGESDCPKDIKAPNGEIHTLKCKVCGLINPKGDCRVNQDATEKVQPDTVTLPRELVESALDALAQGIQPNMAWQVIASQSIKQLTAALQQPTKPV